MERYSISAMTFWRWERDEKLSLPSPVYFGKNKYFILADLEAWETEAPPLEVVGSLTAFSCRQLQLRGGAPHTDLPSGSLACARVMAASG